MRVARRLLVAATFLLSVPPAAFSENPAVRKPGEAIIDWRGSLEIARVDPLYQSFNVEMVEITGGRFWAPYGAPAGQLFAYRPPLDLSDKRLRNLTRRLAPAYMRVSGTWANKTFFDDSAEPASEPPAGFDSVLTAGQWDGANAFARDLGLRVMTSFAVSPGTRDALGHWTADNARRLVDYSIARRYPLAVAEFFNEPNFSVVAGVPAGYSADDYQRDFIAFKALRDDRAPTLKIAGPGTVGEETPLLPIPMSPSSEQILKNSAAGFDIVSYHFYPATSQRCAPMKGSQTTQENALSEEFLAATERDLTYYANLRDRLAPGKPIWLTETGGAACGGNPWSATFLDTFRYVEQLGRLAKHGVQVVMHNTLSASDYALIDDRSGDPRPNYWAAVLWRQLMGERVLDIRLDKKSADVSAYGHCLRGDSSGAVALVLINRDRQHKAAIRIDGSSIKQYALTAEDLSANKPVLLNDQPLVADADGSFPDLAARKISGGVVALRPASINFVVVCGVAGGACGRTDGIDSP